MANVDAALKALEEIQARRPFQAAFISYYDLKEALEAMREPSGENNLGKRTIEIDREIAENYIFGNNVERVKNLQIEIQRALEAK